MGILYDSANNKTLVMGKNEEKFKEYVAKITVEESSQVSMIHSPELHISYINNDEVVSLPGNGIYTTYNSARDALIEIEDMVWKGFDTENLPNRE